jgi:hypothetical protein
VNLADVAFVGFAGEDVIVGVGGALAARAVHAVQPLSARTPSSARGIHALALFAVVVRRLIMIASYASRVYGRDEFVRIEPDGAGGPRFGSPDAGSRWCVS